MPVNHYEHTYEHVCTDDENYTIVRLKRFHIRGRLYFICSSSDGKSTIKLSKIKISTRKNTKKVLMNDNDVCICFWGLHPVVISG